MGFRRRRWRDVQPDKDSVRINRAIRVPEVRVVNEDGQQLGVMATEAARDIAGRSGLDLVEISPNARPPVCKIMDYGRYKYEQKKKASAAKKTQVTSQVKEVKFRPQVAEHDLDFKLRNARRFLMDGDKVKMTVMFRGREIVHQQIGRDLLMRVREQLSEIAKEESRPQMEGRMLSMTVAPDKPAIERLKKAMAEAGEAEPEAVDDPDNDIDEEELHAEAPAEATDDEKVQAEAPAEAGDEEERQDGA